MDTLEVIRDNSGIIKESFGNILNHWDHLAICLDNFSHLTIFESLGNHSGIILESFVTICESLLTIWDHLGVLNHSRMI